ncbi:MAG TPA: PEP-CTERM sorting domain-containing protein [Casimicrobiaceae bacterium]|nr:PEP-CTERM sorting domain-containing protein [Casimicrobiaceae bacterium]
MRPFNVVAPTSASLAFANSGSDNLGAILDNVSVTRSRAAVPEAGTLALLGIAGIALALRRRSR